MQLFRTRLRVRHFKQNFSSEVGDDLFIADMLTVTLYPVPRGRTCHEAVAQSKHLYSLLINCQLLKGVQPGLTLWLMVTQHFNAGDIYLQQICFTAFPRLLCLLGSDVVWPDLTCKSLIPCNVAGLQIDSKTFYYPPKHCEKLFLYINITQKVGTSLSSNKNKIYMIYISVFSKFGRYVLSFTGLGV